ncbi:MAG: rRNA pseudouridine synthase [Actinobacteria bacterium]|nr:rRNA pseudouridine synthase [Actinomycetota bacterium]
MRRWATGPVTTPPDDAAPASERLQKVLARAGFGSRRACEELIAAGRVQVDGQVAVLGDRVDPMSAAIAVDGVAVASRPGLVHYVCNKPRGVVTTAHDPQGRPTVMGLVPPEPRVFPVGRLDLDTEGLLLLTNDGDLAQLLTHPRHGVEKTYLAEVEGVPSPAALRRLREGVDLDDGPTAPARAALVQAAAGDRTTSAVEITIHEGRNRQVRRMCDAIGHPVQRLVRTRIGPLHDARLAPGEWRTLEPREVRALYEAADAAAAPTPPGAAGSRAGRSESGG